MTLFSCVVYIKKTYQAELEKSRFFNGGVYCIAQAVQSNANNDRISETFFGCMGIHKSSNLLLTWCDSFTAKTMSKESQIWLI